MSALSNVAKMLAKAADKGLDVSPQARKARAVEQGYVTNRQLLEMADNPKLEIIKNADKNNTDYSLYAFGHEVAGGPKEYLEQYGDQLVGSFHPAYRTAGLPSPAYMRLNPSKMTAPDFDLDAPAVFYHGTAGDFSSFNPNMLGRNTKAASANHGTFFSNLPEDANYYAHEASATNPLLHRKFEMLRDISQKLDEATKDQVRMEKYGAPKEFVKKNKEYISRLRKNLLRASQANEEKAFPATYPVYLRLDDPMFINKMGEGYGDITKHMSAAKSKGNDSVIFHNINDPNPFATHAAVFDPSRIRSIHAMFDPERINSRDLLASMGGLGALGLTDEVLDEQEPEEYAAGGLVKAGKKVVESIIKNGVEFIKNPTKKEIKRLIQEDPYASARVMRDEEGNVYAFHGNEMLHDEAAKLFNVPYDIENPLENSDVIGLYKGKLHALSAPYENIPHDEWEEWNRRALEMFNLKPAIAVGAGLPALNSISEQYPYE